LTIKKNNVRQETQPTTIIAGTENRCRYDFDAVFGPEATQKDVYDRSVGDTVRRNVSRGTNTTIIAIGQDGFGKRYTMSGGGRTDKGTSIPENIASPVADDDGILPRAVHDLFKAKQRQSSMGEAIVKMSFCKTNSNN
jgi:hypothetical protein